MSLGLFLPVKLNSLELKRLQFPTPIVCAPSVAGDENDMQK
jgi:hypothetical protein